MPQFLMENGFVIMSVFANLLPAAVVIVTVLANRCALPGIFWWLKKELVIDRDSLHSNDAIAIGHALIKLFALWLLWSQNLVVITIVTVGWAVIYLLTDPVRENTGGALTMLGLLAGSTAAIVFLFSGIGILVAYLIVSIPWAFTPYRIKRPSRAVRLWYVAGLVIHLPVVVALLMI